MRTWQQTMIRVKDIERSLVFYRDILGLTLIDKRKFDAGNFSLYFLASLSPGSTYTLEPGTEEAREYLWSYPGVTLELTFNHGTDKNKDFSYHTGGEKEDGFQHLSMAVENVEATLEFLEGKGVKIASKITEEDESPVICDPDGYKISLLKRSSSPKNQAPFVFCETCLKVSDARTSVDFYERLFDMTLVHLEKSDKGSEGTEYFLATLPTSVDKSALKYKLEDLYAANVPILKLVHIDDEHFVYRNGNKEPYRGFGHIGFLVPDVYAFCNDLESQGVKFQKKPDEGTMKGLAFALDPDGYWVEIIKRNQK